MNKNLRANIRNNLVYYRRNRLLLVVGLLFLAVILFSLIPSFFFTSDNERFQLVHQVYKSISFFTAFMVGLIGLISVWSHRANKSVKLVFTRPCSPEIWLVSHYCSAGILFLAGSVLAVLLYVLGSLVWGIPIQVEILAAAMQLFIGTFLVFAYLMLLSAWMHPIAAGMVFLVLSESTFYWLALLCHAGVETLESSFVKGLLITLQKIFHGIYYILPTMGPFDDKIKHLDSSLRLPDHYFGYLGGGLVYLSLFLAFSFCLTVYSIRRRRMN